MPNDQIIKPEYILNRIKATKFNENGVKVVDESKEELVLIKTASQRMFFPLSVAIDLMQDIANLCASKTVKE